MTDRRPGMKFAAFAVVCVLAAAYLVSVTGNLRRIPLLSRAEAYEAELVSAQGLNPGDDVRLAGVRVGRVEGIRLERGRAVVSFTVSPDVVVLRSWEVGARWRNVIGQRYLYLYAVGDGPALEPGGRIPASQSRPVADIGRFFNEITPLLRAIDPEQQNRLLEALNTAIVGRQERIQELVRDLGSLGSTVADAEPEIRALLAQANTLLAEYNRRDEELAGFFTDLAAVGETLEQRNDELLGAVADIAEVQQEFGDLLRDNDAQLRALIDNLEVLTGTVDDNLVYVDQIGGNLRHGLATYLLISRWGQWFNVRAVAFQARDREDRLIYCRTEAGTACNQPASAGPAGPGDAGTGAFDRPVSRAPQRVPALEAVASSALGRQVGPRAVTDGGSR